MCRTNNLLGIFLVLAIFVFGCQSSTNTDSTEESDTTEQTTQKEIAPNSYGERASFDFRQSLDSLVDIYDLMALALANDDLERAQAQVLPFIVAIDGISEGGVNREGQSKYSTRKQEMIKEANTVNKATDLTAARASFYSLSEAIVDMVSTFHTTKESLYLMHSESAFNGSGAVWLSTRKEVTNPYFGSGNLTDGTIKETFSVKNQ